LAWPGKIWKFQSPELVRVKKTLARMYQDKKQKRMNDKEGFGILLYQIKNSKPKKIFTINRYNGKY